MELEKRKKKFVTTMVTPEMIEMMIEERVKQILRMKENAINFFETFHTKISRRA